ncbi:MAG: succinate dehydrogenase assembly factor 2 [Gammaproteobacteria bacterium]|jgi:succinate dehydrogenase flavin-adding protein (antitoxin of CptAB toxin-antitoxin module)|tara:strand:- start:29371 stop:29607 length:237 start_codon:yes stop_codon:yes gene_type:complete
MNNDLLLKKLNFKSRRGMKETTFVVKKLIVGFKSMDTKQKEELAELLDLNDQELFDLVFKNKKLFSDRFPKLKNLLIK